jgi:hypothetical protein
MNEGFERVNGVDGNILERRFCGVCRNTSNKCVEDRDALVERSRVAFTFERTRVFEPSPCHLEIVGPLFDAKKDDVRGL